MSDVDPAPSDVLDFAHQLLLSDPTHEDPPRIEVPGLHADPVDAETQDVWRVWLVVEASSVDDNPDDDLRFFYLDSIRPTRMESAHLLARHLRDRASDVSDRLQDETPDPATRSGFQ